MYRPNLKSVALPVPEIIAIGVLDGVRIPILGRRGRRGSGMVPFERANVSSYRPHSNFFSIFSRFRDIAAFVLHKRHFFPPHLYSPPNFPMFPLE